MPGRRNVRTRADLARSWIRPGSPYDTSTFGDPDYAPVRTNNDLMVNGPPDGWVRDQIVPVGWFDDVSDDGTPPKWWVGRSLDAYRGPIGPHGPWSDTGWTAQPIVLHATSLVVDPLTSYRVVNPDKPTRRYPTPTWLRDPQLLRPDDRVNPYPDQPYMERLPGPTFWRDWVVSALWWGWGFIYYHEDASGQPLAGTMRLLSPEHVTWHPDGYWKIGDLEFDDTGRYYWPAGRVARLIHLRNPHTPLGVFWAFPEIFNLGRKLHRYTDSTFGSGVPSGYLKVTNPAPITQEQADELKARWMRAHGGDRKSIAVLNAHTDFQAIQYSPVDSALSDVKRLVTADVAYAFNLAPALLGTSVTAGGGSMTYANLEQWWEMRRDVTLPPWLGAIEGTLSALLPGNQHVQIDLDEYTYGTFGQRLDYYEKAAGLPGLDLPTIADQLNLPHIGGEQ